MNAYCDQLPRWLGKGLALMLNRESGDLFLTDEDFNVAMMNGGKLDAWPFTPHEGHGGFREHSPCDP